MAPEAGAPLPILPTCTWTSGFSVDLAEPSPDFRAAMVVLI
jgi:hypothetical protein